MCHTPTFFVPVERKALPATDPKRWMMLPVTAVGPFQAIRHAEVIAKAILPGGGFAVWAAVRDCPTFSYMQALRESRDAAFGSRSKRPLSVAGYI